MNNLEWLYENDRDALLDGIVCDTTCADCGIDKYGKCRLRYDPNDSTYREWFLQDHTESADVRAGCDECTFKELYDEAVIEIEKRDKGIERLKRQRDEARDELQRAKAMAAGTVGDCGDCDDLARLAAENEGLARDLEACERERERLRELCSKMLGAHDEARAAAAAAGLL